jgi:hypothetical protein
MKKILYLIVFISLAGCEKNVTVTVPGAEEGLVVEGKIEIDTPAVVILSKTLPFFGDISTSNIVQNTVTGATVIVDDGSVKDTLVQIPGIGVYLGQHIRGEAGKTYNLTIQSGGKTLTSVTTIPFPVFPDSVWWKPEGTLDSLGWAWMHFKDPDTLGNCYKIYAQRINHYTWGDDAGKMKDSTFIASPGGTFGDKFINATAFDLNFARGSFSFSEKADDTGDEKFYFKRGDTIVVKYCSIDFQTHEFWRTENQQVENNGNPFGSPSPITSNISGGLGIWGGYAPAYDTIIAH